MVTDDIIQNFISANVLSIKPMDSGHINDTYLIDSEAGRFICQRLSRDMDTYKLEYNYNLYSKAFDKLNVPYPTMIKSSSGIYFETDEAGDKWRMYPFIEGDILKAPLSEKDVYAVGEGLAEIHKALNTIESPPNAVYPYLHDLNKYHDKYTALIQSYDHLTSNRNSKIEELITNGMEELKGYNPDNSLIVHGDPKLANIIFKEEKVHAFIDFDTVMTGSIAEDIADCIRSCCIIDGALDKNAANILIEAYSNSAEKYMTEIAKEKTWDAFHKICFELGLRYYIDSISDENVFTEKYPGYRQENALRLITIGQNN